MRVVLNTQDLLAAVRSLIDLQEIGYQITDEMVHEVMAGSVEIEVEGPTQPV